MLDHPSDAGDAIDHAIEQWRRERPDLDLSQMAVFGRLVQLAREWVTAIEQVIARHDLSGGEFDVLAALRRSGPPFRLTPSELAATVMMSRAGMTNRLDPDDRRSFQVGLTERGRDVVDAAATDHAASLAPLATALSDVERTELDRTLRTLLNALRSDSGG